MSFAIAGLVTGELGIADETCVDKSFPAFWDTLEELYKNWNAAYAEKPFVNILPSGTFPDTLNVVGTNRADLSAVYDPRTKNFVITSVIDNLLKGASGQAVQNMNIMFDLDQKTGLNLKANYF